MKPTIDLDEDANKFFNRHSARLQNEGLLNRNNIDSFSLLAKIWGELSSLDTKNDPRISTIKFIALLKQYQLLARGFGMNTTDKVKPVVVEQRDEFGI